MLLRILLDLQYLVGCYVAGDSDTAFDPIIETGDIYCGKRYYGGFIRWLASIAP